MSHDPNAGRCLCPECVRQENAARAHARIRELERHLGDLLAIIHGDGGHYAETHGEAKAVEDAKAAWWERSVELDSLRGQVRDEGGDALAATDADLEAVGDVSCGRVDAEGLRAVYALGVEHGRREALKGGSCPVCHGTEGLHKLTCPKRV